MPINPDATIIPDRAEVWLKLASDVANLAAMTPTTADADLAALGWEFSGLIDDKKGIRLEPSGEVKDYDAFGHPAFRRKFRMGKLSTGFTALEHNEVTKKIVLPGSAANKVGIPQDVQIYVLYRYVDDGVSGGNYVWMTLRPALAELKSHGGIVDGELSWAEIAVHHTADANRDVFQEIGGPPLTKVFTLGAGVTAYMATVDNRPTSLINTLTAAGLQTALRGLPNVGNTGVTVTGTGTGPFTAVFTASVLTVLAAGTGGTVTVT